MKNFDFFLNNTRQLESLSSMLQSMDFKEFNESIPSNTRGYSISGKYATKITIYSDDRETTKEEVEKILESSNVSFINENTYVSSIPITILEETKLIYKPLLGTGGSGAGSVATSIQEVGQAIFVSLAFNILKRKLKVDDVTEDNILKGYEDVNDNSVEFSDIEKLLEDIGWKKTFTKTTNLLFRDYYESNKTYTIERGSNLVKSIYDQFKTLKKEEGITASNDKWNPADIWLVSNNITHIDKKNTLADFNEYLKDKFITKDLVGISLKKLGKTPKITVVNLEGSIGKQKFKEHQLSIKSKDMYLVTKKGDKIQFRSANNLSNYRAEIKGTTANHGNAGYGILRYNMQKYGKFVLPKSSGDVASLIKKSDVKTMSRFSELYNKYTGIDVDYRNLKEYVKEMGSNKPEDWLFSKYISMELLDSFESLTNKNKDAYINDIYNYASSKSDFSSVFVKVS